MNPMIEIKNVSKWYGPVQVLTDCSVTINPGDVVVVCGPSGSGKSTLIKTVNGLEPFQKGEIFVDGVPLHDPKTDLPKLRSRVGMVFQHFELFPHLSVTENLTIAQIKVLNRTPDEAMKRGLKMLDRVGLMAHKDKYPGQLSGGQQQRVALARTLVYRPSLLLLDEPLSNLDAKLRERARSWLRHLQQTLRVTTVYVTHDQSEALALSDRIAVMNGGKIVQLADPHTVYRRPADPFVADFIGSSNFLPGIVAEAGDATVRVRLTGATDMPPLLAPTARVLKVGDAVMVAVRPERIRIGSAPNGPDNAYPVAVVESTFLGARNLILVRAGEQEFRVEADAGPTGGDSMIQIPPEACIVFPGSSDRNGPDSPEVGPG
jgi:ABC-type Fe3+/spermidine/putrescine transport system ATPase subunit